MIPLDKQRAMDKVIGMGNTNWRVSIRHEGRETTYTRDASPTLTPMNALGEVLHRFSLDTNLSLAGITKFGGELVRHSVEPDDVEGVAT